MKTIEDFFNALKKRSLNSVDEIFMPSFEVSQDESCLDEDSVEIKLADVKPHYLMVFQSIVDSCGVTAKGLLSAIHGKDFKTKSAIALQKFNDVCKTNAQELLNNSETHFFTYDIALEGYVCLAHGGGHRVNHNFLIIQYKALDGDIRYRFLQSYVSQYSLKEFIERAEQDNNNHDLSELEFAEFVKKMALFSVADTWTEEVAEFYHRYFNVKHEYLHGTICKDVNIDFENGASSIKIEPGNMEWQIEQRKTSLNQALEQLDSKQSIASMPKVVCISKSNRDETLCTKIINAPLPTDKTSAIPVLLQDPFSGEYIYRLLDKRYRQTIEALQSADNEDKAVYYSRQYNSALVGKVVVYGTFFAETRALLAGDRKLFANTNAFLEGKGTLFADTRALLNGTRPFFANSRRALRLIDSENIENSLVGVEESLSIN